MKKNNPVLRWIFFIPVGIAFSAVFNAYNKLGYYYFGGNPYLDYIYLFSKEFLSLVLGLFVALLILPKGKIIVTSILTGLTTLLMILMLVYRVLVPAEIGLMDVIGTAFNLLACIVILILAIMKKIKIDFSKLKDPNMKPLINIISAIGIFLSLSYIGASISEPQLGLPKFFGYVVIIFCVFMMFRKKKTTKTTKTIHNA